MPSPRLLGLLVRLAEPEALDDRADLLHCPDRTGPAQGEVAQLSCIQTERDAEPHPIITLFVPFNREGFDEILRERPLSLQQAKDPRSNRPADALEPFNAIFTAGFYAEIRCVFI